ncbi:hypothetical protein HPP92_024508 [Vanilla planifolia]|uniref:Nuclear transcription factor Y subunit n=1 Tax=Vanilla planifolia TaxID=51239 RepID=A0A835PQF3_VANPL|nr:hypothetical protein HPP92_024508 [Vanilla planifolia]
MSNKDSHLDFVQSTCTYPTNNIPWWNPGGPHIMFYPSTGNMCTNVSPVTSKSSKLVEHQILECESSSVQSSGDSHHTVSEKSEDHCSGHGFSAQSGAVSEKANGKGDEQMDERPNGGNDAKQAFSMGSAQVFFAPPKLEYGQSPAFVPYAFPDAHYVGLMPAYGSHAVIHPQMSGILPGSRLALPLQPTGEEPIYVNAKQYRAILRRREHRAKMESQNKIMKTRKPYLHESRHRHAMKRARGTGGRFLNTKKLEVQAHGSEDVQPDRGEGLPERQLVLQPTMVVHDARDSLFGNGPKLRMQVTR